MGQYYTPVFLSSKGEITHSFNSHEYGNGLKLMEHSYLRNEFVNAVVNTAIALNKPVRIVWAGDYADGEYNKELAKEIYDKLTDDEKQGMTLSQMKKVKDYALFGSMPNLYSLVRDKETNVPDADSKFNRLIRYIVNEDKKEFVDLWYLPLLGHIIHPLPLLTCEGNGRGGGDYYGTSMSLVGSWARDRISFLNGDEPIKGDFKEIKPDFVEEYEIEQAITQALEYLEIGIQSGDFSPEMAKNIQDGLTRRKLPFTLKYENS